MPMKKIQSQTSLAAMEKLKPIYEIQNTNIAHGQIEEMEKY